MGNLVWSSGIIILLFIRLVSLKFGLIRMVFLLLTGPYSPDSNPIDHGWAKLKGYMYLLYPDTESFDSTKK